MDQYRYSPLSKRDSIRLLRVLPGSDPKKLRCKLLEYPLRSLENSCHLYEALSYVWGSEEKPQSIIIDDMSELKITQNLYSGLLRLQNSSFSRMLWVDAICINQSDDTEKQHQIPLMAEIYANANQVLVWLGEAEDGGDQALIMINHASQTLGKHISHTGSERNQIWKLLQRPWFQRTWVLQEVAAARRISIMCGRVAIDGYAFCLGLDFFDAILLGTMPHITFLIRGAIFRSREMLRDRRDQKELSLDICSLGELLDMYHSNKATLRHDKVFALLGMCSDDLESAGLDPNYDLGWKELMHRLVKFILGSQVFINTWENKQLAFIQSEGQILGKVITVKNDAKGGRQKLQVHFKDSEMWHQNGALLWDLPKSAIPVREDDYICLLRGNSKPTIIRPCNGYFVVIMLAAVPLQADLSFVISAGTKGSLPGSGNREFSLVWDWEPMSRLNLDLGNYDDLIQTSMWGSSETKLRKAMRIWSFAQILGDVGEYSKVGKMRLKAAVAYGVALGEEQSQIPLRIPLEGMTILSWAAYKGHVDSVRMFIETGTFNVDEADLHGQTPLFFAAYFGYEEIIRLLLATGKVDMNKLYDSCEDVVVLSKSPDQNERQELPLPWLITKNKTQTPLWFAAKHGHEGVIKLLIATDKADLNSIGGFGVTTPLAIAVKNSHAGVVKLLLETGKVSVVVNGPLLDQPLWLASESGHEGIWKLLVTAGEVSISRKDGKGRTILSYAARDGANKLVKLLLTLDGIGVNLQDNEGRTPLSWAAGNGHEEIVKILLETGKVDVNAADITSAKRTKLALGWEKSSHNWTPLMWAVYIQNEEIVRQLLARSDTNVDAKASCGRTSLTTAVVSRHEGIIQLLLSTGKADVNASDRLGQTPLNKAVGYSKGLYGATDSIELPEPPRPRGVVKLLKSLTRK